ncbi:MAG: VWA domain-containing protein [Lapillicoccus sp.]
MSLLGGPLALGWLVVAVLAGVVVVAVVGWLLLRRRRTAPPVAVANTEALRALPEYRQAVRRHRLLMLGAAVLAAVVALAAALGSARPMRSVSLVSERDNRDIVLCLDVSGSMIDVDAEVVSTFTQLVAGFRGERISMVIFNSSAVPVFPLTDDYDFVVDQLKRAQRALGLLDPKDPFFAGTLNGFGSSLIGDGLATCVRSFDHPELQRARSVILASDNEAAGKSLFTLPEGGRLAKSAGIQVYGINPTDNISSSTSAEMRTVTENTGGLYFSLSDVSAVRRTLEAVSSREASRIPASPRTVVHDNPGVPIALAGLGLLAFLALRRARWRR